jgi:hypothetical protein
MSAMHTRFHSNGVSDSDTPDLMELFSPLVAQHTLEMEGKFTECLKGALREEQWYVVFPCNCCNLEFGLSETMLGSP